MNSYVTNYREVWREKVQLNAVLTLAGERERELSGQLYAPFVLFARKNTLLTIG